MFLSESSLFDPRFQSVTVETESLQDIKDSVAHRFEHLIANDVIEQKPIKLESKTPQRKSCKYVQFSLLTILTQLPFFFLQLSNYSSIVESKRKRNNL